MVPCASSPGQIVRRACADSNTPRVMMAQARPAWGGGGSRGISFPAKHARQPETVQPFPPPKDSTTSVISPFSRTHAHMIPSPQAAIAKSQ